jgi:hypothetical protein
MVRLLVSTAVKRREFMPYKYARLGWKYADSFVLVRAKKLLYRYMVNLLEVFHAHDFPYSYLSLSHSTPPHTDLNFQISDISFRN